MYVLFTLLMHLTIMPFFEAWCVTHIWNWFLPSMGAPQMNVWAAYGAATLFGIFKASPKDFVHEDKGEAEGMATLTKLANGHWAQSVWLAFILGICWVAHKIMVG